ARWIFISQPVQRSIENNRIMSWRPGFENGSSLFNAKPPQKFRLSCRAVHPRANSLGGFCQGLKIHMRGKVDQAGRCERFGEGMATHGLQGIADAASEVTVVEDEGDALEFRHPPPDLKRHLVAAPFESIADLRAPHITRQMLAEQGNG